VDQNQNVEKKASTRRSRGGMTLVNEQVPHDRNKLGMLESTKKDQSSWNTVNKEKVSWKECSRGR
jgi:hypothetical protein